VESGILGLFWSGLVMLGLQIRIRMDPHYFSKLDPDLDLHEGKQLDLDPH
jgi:hypothetical protein